MIKMFLMPMNRFGRCHFSGSDGDSPSPGGEGRGEGEFIVSRIREALINTFMRDGELFAAKLPGNFPNRI
jgi:hypothetical protein